MARACSPPAQIAARTTPAVPRTRSFAGMAEPVSIPGGVFHPAGVIRAASRASATCSAPGASSLSAVTSPPSPRYSEASARHGAVAASRAAIPAARAVLGPAQRPGLADLGQHRGQAADSRVYRVAIGTRPARRPIVRHLLGQPWTVVVLNLTQNPRPRRLAELPVDLARRTADHPPARCSRRPSIRYHRTHVAGKSRPPTRARCHRHPRCRAPAAVSTPSTSPMVTRPATASAALTPSVSPRQLSSRNADLISPAAGVSLRP